MENDFRVGTEGALQASIGGGEMSTPTATGTGWVRVELNCLALKWIEFELFVYCFELLGLLDRIFLLQVVFSQSPLGGKC